MSQLAKFSDIPGLTAMDIIKLCYPFTLPEHKFTQGLAYIREDAIAFRLDKIDPNWHFNQPSFSINGHSVVAVSSLVVKGVVRGNAGAGTALATDKENQFADNMGNAYKGAATDAFKRCARLFGIGRYLLNAPKEGPAFATWLNGLLAQAKKQYDSISIESIEVTAEDAE